MRTKNVLIKLTAAIALIGVVPGCGIIRNIEQWKCDNLGLCHFGIEPSCPAPVGCDVNPATIPPPMLLSPPNQL
jgi:hypothetical protein